MLILTFSFLRTKHCYINKCRSINMTTSGHDNEVIWLIVQIVLIQESNSSSFQVELSAYFFSFLISCLRTDNRSSLEPPGSLVDEERPGDGWAGSWECAIIGKRKYSRSGLYMCVSATIYTGWLTTREKWECLSTYISSSVPQCRAWGWSFYKWLFAPKCDQVLASAKLWRLTCSNVCAPSSLASLRPEQEPLTHKSGPQVSWK